MRMRSNQALSWLGIAEVVHRRADHDDVGVEEFLQHGGGFIGLGDVAAGRPGRPDVASSRR